MRKMLLLFLVAVMFSVLYTACDVVDLTPAPEVEIVRFQPYGVYIDSLWVEAQIESITFMVTNHVDAIVREMDVDYRSVNSGDIVASNYTAGFGMQLSGGTEW